MIRALEPRPASRRGPRATSIWLLAALTVGSAALADPPRARLEVPSQGARAEEWTSLVTRVERFIYDAPDIEATVLGRTSAGGSYPLVALGPSGHGCSRQWASIAADRWVCGQEGTLVQTAPRSTEGLSPLAWRFARARRDTLAWPSESAYSARDTSSAERWLAGWAFAVRDTAAAGRLLRTREGFLVPRRDVSSLRAPSFHGASWQTLTEGAPEGVRPGWTWRGEVPVFDAPPGTTRRPRVLRRLRRHVVVQTLELQTVGGNAYLGLVGGGWVRRSAVRLVTPAQPPPEVDAASRERWIDVDLTEQVLVAYEGATPVYATLVSTGAAETETEPGTFRVRRKHYAWPMSDLGNPRARRHFNFRDVPWVQFFDARRRALHAVYWHRDWGRPRSHGCVNLAPRDAAWLFEFTTPSMPEGWTWVTSGVTPGTVVHVHGRAPVRARPRPHRRRAG